MLLARVIGTVVATRKEPTLEGLKLLLLENTGPKGRNARDLRDGYDAEGRPTRVGKCGFYLRPGFVAETLKNGAP